MDHPSTMSKPNAGKIVLTCNEDLEVFLQFHGETYRTVMSYQESYSDLFNDPTLNERKLSNKFKKDLLKIAEESDMTNALLSFAGEILQQIHIRDTQTENKKRKAYSDLSNSAFKMEQIISRRINTEDGADMEDRSVSVLYTRSKQPSIVCNEGITTTPSARFTSHNLGQEDRPELNEDPRVWLTLPLKCVQNNRLDILNLCIKTGLNMEIFRDVKGSSLLHEAITCFANNDMIDTLLQHIDVNILNDLNEPPMKAVLANDNISSQRKLELMRKLLSVGASFEYESTREENATQNYILSLIHIQNEEMIIGWRAILDEIFSSGVNINGIDWFLHTALTDAINNVPPPDYEEMYEDHNIKQNLKSIRKHKADMVEYLLQKGSDPNICDSSGRTSLHNACLGHNIDIVEKVIRFGACVNSVSHLGMTAIYSLCTQADWSDIDDTNDILIPIITMLVNSGCDINKQGSDRTTVLHFAAAKLNFTICKNLLHSGANIEERDYLQRTPLHMSARNPDSTVSSLLLQFGANCDSYDVHKDTPLHYSCLSENTTVANVLLEHGANVCAQDDMGIQPIHVAAENGGHEMLNVFIRHGADIDARDIYGATPLHYAASDGNPETTEFLIQVGANKMASDDLGRTPIDLARLRGQYKPSTLLANTETEVTFGNMPVGLFPNRPLIDVSEVDDYFIETGKQLACLGTNSIDSGKAILSTPGLGRVDLGKGESLKIFQTIQQFVEKVLVRVGEIDPLFKGHLLNAGSTYEGVKIGYPDEFDFLVHLENFSQVIDKIEKGETPGFSKVLVKSPLPERYEKFCMGSNKYLNAAFILRYFCKLLRSAKHDVLTTTHDHLYAGFTLLHEQEPFVNNLPIPMMNLLGLSISWRGKEYKFMDISIDVNPVIFTSDWPNEAITECSLAPNMQKMGMYLIPKHCEKIFAVPSEIFLVNSYLWRYSFAHVEAAIIQSLPQAGKDCYMLCKALRMEPLCCGVNLKKMEPLENQNDDDDDDDDDVDDDEDDDDDNDEMEKGVKGKTWRETDSAEEMRIQEYNGISGAVNIPVTDEYDEIWETEITAEKIIPSYYLKSIFLREVNLLYEQNKTITENDIKSIPRKVYDAMLQATLHGHLSTVFIPTQNIYSHPKHFDNVPGAKELRKQFCMNIVQLLETLGFKTE